MNCKQCRSPMDLVKTEATKRSVMEWYLCPWCQSRHLLSEPVLDVSMLGTDAPLILLPNTTSVYASRPAIGRHRGPERRAARRP